MTISEKIQQLDAIEAYLRGGANTIVAQYAADLCADISDRVINKGVGADGSPFSPYSTKPVPAFWYYGKSVNAGGEAKVRAKGKKGEGVSYRDFREYNGRQVSKKDFSFTNAMWRGFGVKSAQFTGGAYIVTIGGKTADSADKIAWMGGQERRSIIAPAPVEVERLASRIVRQIIQLTSR